MPPDRERTNSKVGMMTVIIFKLFPTATGIAMAHRVVTLLERIGMEPKFAITGGIAKNVGVVSRLEGELKIKALRTDYDTQIAGALGGALFATALVKKERAKGA